jgi:hypothetical protein
MREKVSAPNFLTSLQQKPAEITQLARICSELLSDPANHMAGLSARLVEALEGPCEPGLLLFVPTLAVDLLQAVPPKRVEELSLLLLYGFKDPAQLQTIKYLRTHCSRLKDKLVLLLNRSEKITMSALQQLISPCFEELALVTEAFLCFFKPSAWGQQIPLRYHIQAEAYSNWVLLEDGRVFCSGGEY